METRIYPAWLTFLSLPVSLKPSALPGYDYQRDDEATTWGSADLQYSLTYIM
ncbi:hypothetical protein FOB33_29445 [Klebsiella variicola]|nr:phage tail terminator protein [Klebsiella variicola]NKR39168.1 hypothetical protein [Klebsiella variicola]